MVIGYRVAIVPDRLQGRVNSVARSLALLAFPLGPVVAGLLLGSHSARIVAGVRAGRLHHPCDRHHGESFHPRSAELRPSDRYR